MAIKILRINILNCVLMFLLVDIKAEVLEVQILFMFLMIRGFLLDFFNSNLFYNENVVCWG